MLTRNWFHMMKFADGALNDPMGHGDTLHGQMRKHEQQRLLKAIERMKTNASSGMLGGVLPRWRGEVRRKIFMLPPVNRIARMSMYELGQLSRRVSEIEALVSKYSAERFEEIVDADHTHPGHH